MLILLGAFTKSAQFPFHFWLPNAMAAPTPVSAYLHSATMVKAGVFLLARLFPALSGTPEWSGWSAALGLTTLLIGAVFALFKHDLKGLLAYSTISHLGLITLLFGIGTPLAAVAGVFHIINHATFKASLFMAAGHHRPRDRHPRHAPHQRPLALHALYGHAGHGGGGGHGRGAAVQRLPVQGDVLRRGRAASAAWCRFGWLVPAAVTLAGVFAVAYSLRFIHDVFFNGEPVDLPRTPHEPPRWMKVPVEVLVALCLLVGMLPALTVEPLLAVAAARCPARAAAGPRPGHLARLQPGPVDEPDRPDRRRAGLSGPPPAVCAGTTRLEGRLEARGALRLAAGGCLRRWPAA